MDPASSSQPERYASLTEAGILAGYRLGALVAAVLFAAGVVLDVATQPQDLVPLLSIRALATGAFLLLWVLAARGRYPLPAVPSAFAAMLLAAAAITAMCVVTGGYASPYYGGINLVLLAGGVLFPWGWRTTLGACAGVAGVWFVGTLLLTDPDGVEQAELFVNNVYFMLSSALIAIASAGWTERQRRESFARLVAAEEAQARIDRSRATLQAELTDRMGNLEELAAEVARQRHELADALEDTRRARDQAERALRLRDEFLSVASHELRSPLTGLRLQLEVAKRASRDLDERADRFRGTVDVALSQAERLGRLVDDMLDVSRLAAGRLTVELQHVRLHDLVRGVAERCGATLAEAGCPVDLDVPHPIEGVWDPLRLEQVLENLLSNAAKYGAGRPVHVSAWQEDGVVRLAVRDEGVGVPAADRDRIFEPFERSAATASIRGLGLGLYIVRQIVEAHGGHVEVTSEPERGSTFLVTLPVRARLPAGAHASA